MTISAELKNPRVPRLYILKRSFYVFVVITSTILYNYYYYITISYSSVAQVSLEMSLTLSERPTDRHCPSLLLAALLPWLQRPARAVPLFFTQLGCSIGPWLQRVFPSLLTRSSSLILHTSGAHDCVRVCAGSRVRDFAANYSSCYGLPAPDIR